MVIDHAGEVLCTQGCVFEDIVKLKRMGKAKSEGGGKKRKNNAIQKTRRLQPHGKQMITSTCNWKFQVMLSEENCLGTAGGQARPISWCCSRGESVQSSKDLSF